LKIPKLFRPPTAHELALQEMQEAERQLLLAHTQQEYAAAMIAYNTSRVERLRETLKEEAT
jgi:hypothetical protein